VDILARIFQETWELMLASAPFILFGLLIGGLLKTFLHPGFVARHLGKGKVGPVLKTALWGVPLPLCSCGVLPAAQSLKRQGANRGALTSFLIATPESGVDSIAASYALLDPLLTIARPVAALATAVAAGLAENFLNPPKDREIIPDLTCPVDSCCPGVDCPEEMHRRHHTWKEKFVAGLRFAVTDLWSDLAGLFFVGLILAGIISALVPEQWFSEYLGGGIVSMLLMLLLGIPIYICATSSTPIAAALILKGVSPGAALVFLLAGPATNITSLTVLGGILGRSGVALYLGCLAVFSVAFGLAVDAIYSLLGISAQATVGAAAEDIPLWLGLASVALLLIISVKPLASESRRLAARLTGRKAQPACGCCGSSESCPAGEEHCDHP